MQLFGYITEKFINWLTATRSGIDYFLICDALSVRRDYGIVEMEISKGIHFINFISGYLHWSQVHVREPSGILKNQFQMRKKTFSPPAAAKSRIRQTISMSQFYKVEANAYEPQVLADAFRKVGLSP